MKANPRYAHFCQVLEKRSSAWLGPWEGDCWRYQAIGFPSSKEILSGDGAYMNGGRWNAPDSFRTIYGSTDDVTAVRESRAVAKYYGVVSREPRLLVCLHAKLKRLLDLTDAKVRRSLGVTLKEIEAENWRKLQDSGKESFSQSLGRAARKCGAEGILVPSFASKKGVNVAIFPRDLDPGSFLGIWEQAKLDKMLKGR